MTKSDIIAFGDEAASHFPFEDGLKNLNHGSYGAIPAEVQEAREHHMREAIGNPDAFFRKRMFPRIAESRKIAADLVDADVDNVVFVSNATTGVNTVLRGYDWKKGDKVVYCNTIYGACENTLRFVEKYNGVELIKIDLMYPMTDDEVVNKYCEALDSNPRVRFLFCDVVSSVPGVRIPFERLCAEARSRGILSIVDGAHCIGLLDGISLSKARPDFFVTNLHKWLFVPNSLALLYVDRAHHKSIETLPTSHPVPYVEKTYLADKFAFVGTQDMSSILTVPDALKFREKLGGEQAIVDYTRSLAQSASQIVVESWKDGAELLNKKVDCAMFNIKLPSWVNNAVPIEKHEEFSEKYIAHILDKYKTFVPIFSYEGALWSRWSSQVYLTSLDFEQGAKMVSAALKDLLAESN